MVLLNSIVFLYIYIYKKVVDILEVTKPADSAFNPFADMSRPQQKSQ